MPDPGISNSCTCTVSYLGHLVECVARDDLYLVKILLTASRKTITKNGLKADMPQCKQWLSIIEEIQGMEKLTYKLKLKEELFARNWGKWIQNETYVDMTG